LVCCQAILKIPLNSPLANELQDSFSWEEPVRALAHGGQLALTDGQIARAVVDDVIAFSSREQFDDITLIVAKRLEG